MNSGSNPKDWKPALLKHIDIDQIPEQYGGTAPTLSPSAAIENMNPPRDGRSVSGDKVSGDSSSAATAASASTGGRKELKHAHSTGETGGGASDHHHKHHHNHHNQHHASKDSPSTTKAKKGFFGRSNTTPINASTTTPPVVVTAVVPRHRDASSQTDVCAEEYVILDNSEYKAHNNYWSSMYQKLVTPLVATKGAVKPSSSSAAAPASSTPSKNTK